MKHLSLEKRFDTTLSAYSMIEEGDRVLLGLSGGSDSVCLFHLLLSQRKKLGFSLYVCHFNHGIRGEEAERDERFVKELCEREQVELFVGRAKVVEEAKNSGESVEECARRLRYAFFEELCEKHGLNKIAVAHNLSDRSETLLFNLSRGSGLSGLRSIPPVRGRVIRPLCECTKEEIENFCLENGYAFCTDSTNADTDYARNFIRHKVLEPLRELNEDFDRSVSSLCANLMELEDMVDSEVSEFLQNHSQKGRVNRTQLKKIHPYAAKRAIDTLYKRFVGNNNTQGLEKKHLDTALCFICEAPSGKSLDMPGKVVLSVEYDEAFFALPERESHGKTLLSLGDNTSPFGRFELFLFEKGDPDAPDIVYTLFKQAFLDYDKIEGDIYVRQRGLGDCVRSKGMSKSVKQFLIDKKIPLSQRNTYPVFCDSVGVVWVPGLAVDDRVKIKEDTERVLTIKIKEDDYAE